MQAVKVELAANELERTGPLGFVAIWGLWALEVHVRAGGGEDVRLFRAERELQVGARMMISPLS